MKEIASALVKAQKAFVPALKTKTNPHLKSKYADLGSCIDAVVDALNENGITLIQKTHDAPGGVAVETMFLHESGEHLSTGRLFLPATKLDAQGYGSALTYARRYSLMAACGIAPEDDDGQSAGSSETATQKPSSVVIDGIKDAASRGSADLEKAFKANQKTPYFPEWWQANGKALKDLAAKADAA